MYPKRQSRDNRHIRILELPTRPTARRRIPGFDCFLVEPHRDVATPAKRSLLPSPVLHLIFRLYPVWMDFGVTRLFVLAATPSLPSAFYVQQCTRPDRGQPEPCTNAAHQRYAIVISHNPMVM